MEKSDTVPVQAAPAPPAPTPPAPSWAHRAVRALGAMALILIMGLLLMWWAGAGGHGRIPFEYPSGGGPFYRHVDVVDPEDHERYAIGVPMCYHWATPTIRAVIEDDRARASRAGPSVRDRLALLAKQCAVPYSAAGSLLLGDEKRSAMPILWQLALAPALQGATPDQMAMLRRYIATARTLGPGKLAAYNPAVRETFLHVVSAKDLPSHDEAVTMLPYALSQSPGLRSIRVAMYDDVLGAVYLRSLDLNVLRNLLLGRWKHVLDTTLEQDTGATLTTTPCICPAHLGILGSDLVFWPRALGQTGGGDNDWHIYAGARLLSMTGEVSTERFPRAFPPLHAFPWALDGLFRTDHQGTAAATYGTSARFEVSPIANFDRDVPLPPPLDGVYQRAYDTLGTMREQTGITRAQGREYLNELKTDMVPDVVRLFHRAAHATDASVLAVPLPLTKSRVDVIGAEFDRCQQYCLALEHWLLVGTDDDDDGKEGL